MDTLEHFLTDYYDGQSCKLFARGSAGLYGLFNALYECKGAGEVIIPAICSETVAMPAIYAGLTPVFVDVDIDTLCLSYHSVLEKLSDKTLAIMVVYMFGHAFNPLPFQQLKDTHDIILIEDIVPAAGGSYAGQQLGRFFDFTLLSFADYKIIKGQGGALIQRNPEYHDLLQLACRPLPPSPASHILQRKLLSLRNLTHALFDLSRTDPSVDISHTFQSMIPFYRDLFVRQGEISNEDLLISQFQKLKENRERRYEKYLLYKTSINNEAVRVIEFSPGTMCWRLPVLMNDPINAFHLTTLLRQQHILVSNHYFPLDKLFNNEEHPNATYVGARVLNLWVDDLAPIDTVHKTVELINSYQPVVS